MLTHDKRADAAYLQLSSAPIARTEEFSDQLILDYAADGSVRGVEILFVAQGVDLTGLPSDLEMRVGRALEEHGIRTLVH